MEAEERGESLRRRIEAQLEAEPEVKAVFGRLWEGDQESAEIAQQLGMQEKAVVLARRRLARRLKRLRGAGLRELELNRTETELTGLSLRLSFLRGNHTSPHFCGLENFIHHSQPF